MTLAATPAHAADAKAPVSDAEKATLLDAAVLHAKAVVALNDAMASAQELRRARQHVAGWRREAFDSAAPFVPAEVADLEEALASLEGRFLHLYMAHFGKPHNTGRKEISAQARQYLADARARADARKRFEGDSRAALRRAEELVKQYKAAVKQALHKHPLPEGSDTPAFREKPPATLRPDGTSDGIIFGTTHEAVAGDHTWRLARLLHLSWVAGVYQKYDTDYKVSPMAAAAERGQKAEIIVPCARDERMYCPTAWYNAHKDEPILRRPQKYTGHWLMPLDFWYPPVQEMMREFLTEVGKRYRDNPNVLVYKTAWESQLNLGGGAWGRWPTSGRTVAGRKAFREYLRRKFGTIEALNAAWKSDYTEFDAIEPPPDLYAGPSEERGQLTRRLAQGRCGALYYEFNRFLKDSYAAFLAFCYQTLKKADPNHAIEASPSYGSLDGYLCTGRDSFLWAEKVCDQFQPEAHESFDKVLTYSVRRSTGRATGISEWIWNGMECRSLPREDVLRAAARRNFWRVTGWGDNVLGLYGMFDTYGRSGGKPASGNNLCVFESDYRLLRRSAGIVSYLTRKIRSMEDVLITTPIVAPKIIILKPSVSTICAWPWEIVTTVSRDFHELLYGRNYHYAFVPEEYVLSGRDDLSNYHVVILPWASHFPPGLAGKLLAYVQAGGVVVAAGVPGAFTPYGEADGTFPRAVFGDIRYAPQELEWLIKVDGLRPEAKDIGKRPGRALLAQYGKGTVLMGGCERDWRPETRLAEAFYNLLDRHAPREAWAEGMRLELILREKDSVRYLTVINPSSKAPAATRIHLAGLHRAAVDMGIEGGFPIPLERHDRAVAFNISLAPGEGTMVRIER